MASLTREIRIMAVVAAVAAWMAGPLGADTVTLVNGNTVEGVIVQESDRLVVVDTPGGQMTIPRSRVESIVRGGAWALELRRVEEAYQRGEWTDALALHRSALGMIAEAGVTLDSETQTALDQIVAACEEQLRSESAARFADLLEEIDGLVAAGNHQMALDRLGATMAEEAPDSPAQAMFDERAASVLLALADHQRDMIEPLLAVATLRRALEHDAGIAEIHLDLGMLLAARDQTDLEAITELEQAIALFPPDADPEQMIEAHFALGQCLQACGEYLRATDAFTWVHEQGGQEQRRALGLAVDSLMALVDSIPVTEENFPTLIEHLSRARALDPLRIEPLNMLADLYREISRDDDALALYQASLGLRQSQANIHLVMGEIHLERGEADRAEEFFANAIQYDPNSYSARCYLAEAYESRGRFREAQAQLASAIETSDLRAWAYMIRGRIHRRLENLDQARDDFERAIELQGNAIDPHLEMGLILTKQGEHLTARHHFERALDLVESGEITSLLDPDTVRAKCHIGLARIHLQRNELNQAVDALNSALELDPNYPDVHAALGQAHEMGEDYEAAEQAYLRAVELDPDDASIYFRLALLHQNNLDNREAAIENCLDYLRHHGTDIRTIHQMLRELGVDPETLNL